MAKIVADVLFNSILEVELNDCPEEWLKPKFEATLKQILERECRALTSDKVLDVAKIKIKRMEPDY